MLTLNLLLCWSRPYKDIYRANNSVQTQHHHSGHLRCSADHSNVQASFINSTDVTGSPFCFFSQSGPSICVSCPTQTCWHPDSIWLALHNLKPPVPQREPSHVLQPSFNAHISLQAGLGKLF